jgi:putative membrane protein insertion efficiency factor
MEVNPLNKLMVKLIDLYKKQTENKNPTCRYHPTCSTYAKEAYQTRNFFIATVLSIWRILRCNPFSKGGFDPVPKPKNKKNHPH